MFEGVGVAMSVSPPATPGGRFIGATPGAPGPRGLPTPDFPGDGGRGCSFFNLRIPDGCGPRGVSVAGASAFCDAELCC